MSPFFRRGDVSAPTVQNRPDDLTPVSVPRDGRERFRVALGGISEELAALSWDWRERTAGERAQDDWAALERIASPADRLAAKFAYMVQPEPWIPDA